MADPELVQSMHNTQEFTEEANEVATPGIVDTAQAALVESEEDVSALARKVRAYVHPSSCITPSSPTTPGMFAPLSALRMMTSLCASIASSVSFQSLGPGEAWRAGRILQATSRPVMVLVARRTCAGHQ